MKVELEKLKILPDHVKSLLENFNKVKSNQNSMCDVVSKLKDRGS